MANFKTIHTLYALRRLNAAQVSGVSINLPVMAVGDGNGASVEPSESQSQLVRERYRAPVNRVYQDADRPTIFIAELVVPASVGAFTIREAAAFDDTGSLFVVSNTPAVYKPVASEGSYGDTLVRIEFAAQNADVITLQIDPHVAVASQFWVLNNVNSALLIPGGTTGQLLRKISNADGDTEWHDPDDINVTVDTIEETQELVDLQTVVDLAVTTTRGLALYINGERLRRDQWTPDPAEFTRLTLATAYPDGTKLIAAQNEPTGNAPAPLERSKNLSDVASVATARSNLDVYSKAEADRICPIGTPSHFPSATLPAGWLVRNGAAISRTAYWKLFEVLGTTYGIGDGFNTFNLPDDRGGFDGNADLGRGLDAEFSLGGWFGSRNAYHDHAISIGENGEHEHGLIIDPVGDHSHGGGSLVKPGVQAYSTLEEGHGGLDYPVGPVLPAGGHAHSGKTGRDGRHGHAATVSSSGSAHARPNARAYMPIIRAY